jgi:transcriptional regulator with XRE-family HTH domain
MLPPAPDRRIDGSGIVRERKNRGVSQEALAAQLGISSGYLSMLEAGRRIPSKAVAARLSGWLASDEP